MTVGRGLGGTLAAMAGLQRETSPARVQEGRRLAAVGPSTGWLGSGDSSHGALSGWFYVYLRDENTGFAGQLGVGVRERRTSRTAPRDMSGRSETAKCILWGSCPESGLGHAAFEMRVGDQWMGQVHFL